MEEIERVRKSSLAYVDQIEQNELKPELTKDIEFICSLDKALHVRYEPSQYSRVFYSKGLKHSFPKSIMVEVESPVKLIDFVLDKIYEDQKFTTSECDIYRIWENTENKVFLSLIAADCSGCKISYGVGLCGIERWLSCDATKDDPILMEKVTTLIAKNYDEVV